MPSDTVGIMGFGLAGALLAHALERLGVAFCWADEPGPNPASPMAPGIINPLAGRRFKLNTDYASSHRETLSTFVAIEELTEARIWHPTPLFRLIENAEQAAELEARRREAPDWIGQIHPAGAHGSAVHDPFGSFETLQAGWLDVRGLTHALRSRYHAAEVPVSELADHAERVVDCRGWRCQQEARWADLPWKNARGEVLQIELEGELPRHLWNGGGWLQPMPNGQWRAGATYAWSQFEATPSLIARTELVGKLQRWLRLPFRIVSQSVGVRAVVVDYRPVLGPHPVDENAVIFSGLGSHGAILGPLYARHLAGHLAHGSPLDRDIAVARFLQ
jgi:glycine/D-amino acid oxidase-like deaminating enzyme